MKIRVKYFAVLREIAGKREEVLELADGSKLSDLWGLLQEIYPQLKGKESKLSFAVNRQYARGEHPLSDGDEVAILPPVAGGASEEELQFDVSSEPLELQKLIELVQGDFGGAVVTFLGIVRGNTEGRKVEYLEYEAYREMAIEELRSIGEKVRERWPGVEIAIHHRVGKLSVGEASVAIAVCSPHRAEGFEACRFAIEELKKRVPIWKREVFEDGSEWVGWGS